MTPLREARIRLPVSETDLAYIGCLIDTEGSIIWLSEHHLLAIRQRVVISVSNTDRELIDWLLGFGGAAHPTASAKKPCWRWDVVARRDVVTLLAAVLPYMRIKRVAARAALDHAIALLPDDEEVLQ